MMRKVIFVLTLFMISASAWGQDSPVGVWKTIDDKSGEAKSHIEIFRENGKYYGKIIKLLRKGPDTVCEKCPGDKKNKKLVGMLILEDLAPHDDYWKDGSILDPESGKEYACSIWFEDGKSGELRVRG